jgi:hypothetical protein
MASARAVFALVVDAKNSAAESFYLRLGFRALADNTARFFLPIETAAKAWTGGQP